MKKFLICSIGLISSLFFFSFSDVKAFVNEPIIGSYSSNKTSYYNSDSSTYSNLGSYSSWQGFYNLFYDNVNNIFIVSSNNGSLLYDMVENGFENFFIYANLNTPYILFSRGDGVNSFYYDGSIKNVAKSETVKFTPSYSYINSSYDFNTVFNTFSINETIDTYINNNGNTNLITFFTNFGKYQTYDIYDRNNNLVVEKNFDISVSTPEISITETYSNEFTTNFGNTVTSSKIYDLNFSLFNLNKYKYYYRLDNGSWNLINENDYNLTLTKNHTIYVKITDLNDNVITSSTYTVTGISQNIVDYEIEEGTENGKKLTISYSNFDDNSYFLIENFQTGIEKRYDLNLMGNIIYDNINLDNSYTINAYDHNDNLILTRTIDIQSEVAKLNNDRYISITYDGRTSNRVLVNFFNTKNNDKCFTKLSNENEEEIDCSNESILVESNKNTYFEAYIKDKNNNIVVKKGINLNYLDNYPKFSFDSYFNDTENKQTLKIIIDNLRENDLVYYSYDKEVWNQLENKRINFLDFYTSCEIYFKVERNNEIVSEAYFDLVYNSYENSSNNNNLVEEKGLNGSLNILKKITSSLTNEPLNILKNIYSNMVASKFGLYIYLVIVTSIVLLIVKSIKR